MRKLNASNTAGLVWIGFELGLLQINYRSHHMSVIVTNNEP